MKIITETLGKYGMLTGFLHEPHPQLSNIKARPAVLAVPGGGFRMCSFPEGEPIAQAYLAEGFQTFVLKYTTVTDDPDAVMADPMRDACQALRFIRSHAEEFGINPNQVAMIGFSGGAHLSAAVSTHGPERPDALLLGYPGIVHNPLRALDCPDIIECVDEKTPVSFIFGVHDDPVTPPVHALSFACALNKAGVPFELHLFRGQGHGMSLGKNWTCGGHSLGVNPAYAEWFPMSVRWLKDVFGEFSPVDPSLPY